MLLGFDFDGSIVREDDHAYDDLVTPLQFIRGAQQALKAFRRAGHIMILDSGRANRALTVDPMLDPLVRLGVKRLDRERWEKDRPLHLARLEQMHKFVADRCPGIFDAIDDGLQGKPHTDLSFDNQGTNPIRFPGGWPRLAHMYGDPEE